MQQPVLVSIRFRVTKKPMYMCAHTPAGCLKPGKQVRIYLGKMRCLSRARNLDGARAALAAGPGPVAGAPEPADASGRIPYQ